MRSTTRSSTLTSTTSSFVSSHRSLLTVSLGWTAAACCKSLGNATPPRVRGRNNNDIRAWAAVCHDSSMVRVAAGPKSGTYIRWHGAYNPYRLYHDTMERLKLNDGGTFAYDVGKGRVMDGRWTLVAEIVDEAADICWTRSGANDDGEEELAIVLHFERGGPFRKTMITLDDLSKAWHFFEAPIDLDIHNWKMKSTGRFGRVALARAQLRQLSAQLSAQLQSR